MLNDPEFKQYNYFNGEKENPYVEVNGFVLNFENPRSLFWYYEEFHFKMDGKEDFKRFMENLIHDKLSEYLRSDYDLWELYFKNSIK